MADNNQNPATSVASAVTTQENTQENWIKNSFFWGNEAVFENLEKFERISNPTDENQDFDFSFTDEEQGSLESDQNINDEENTDVLQGAWLDTMFTASASEEKPLDPMNTLYDQPDENISSPSEEAWLQVKILPQENENSEEKETEEEYLPQQSFENENFEKNSEIPEDQAEEVQEVSSDEETKGDDSVSSEDTATEWKENSELEDISFSQSEANISFENENDEAVENENIEQSSEQIAALEMESEPKRELSDLMKKYEELFAMGKRILKLENKISKEEKSVFEILGNNTEKSMITYEIFPLRDEHERATLTLIKTEKDFVRNEESQHTLTFSSQETEKNLLITVDNQLLYEEEKDLQDPVKAMQVSDKINKFSFLFEQRLKELEEEWEKIKAEKERIKPFRDIFRNF